MSSHSFQSLVDLLLPAWLNGQHLPEVKAAPLPASRAEGYAAQKALFEATGDVAIGWKIAATSKAGQQHIGVSGPLAGRLLSSRRLPAGAQVSLGNNLMRVMEPEFAFRMASDVLGVSSQPLGMAEVMAHVQDMHLAIEIPDSRYVDFVHAGEAMLLADFACANLLVLGEAVTYPWRELDLSQHAVEVFRHGTLAAQGSGANVLGDPRTGLTWLANELISHGMHLRKGDTVITGTCVVPVTLNEGDAMLADFGVLGTISVNLG
jgi:2-keto-4-pentenoate hydratase